MKSKKHKKIHSFITIILLVLIALFTYEIVAGESKEVKEAKSFMIRLERMYAINLTEPIKEMKFEVINPNGNIDATVGYTVATKNYGIDLDKEYRVVGFSKKEAKHGNKVNITEEEAINIAKKFSTELTDESLEYKGMKTVEGQDLPYYNVAFSKTKGDYSYLDKEVVVQIDKYTGELDGYSNVYLDDFEHISTKKISEEQAIEGIKTYLNKLGYTLTEQKLKQIGYVTIAEKKNVLAYLFDIKYVDKDGENHDYTIQVSTFSGDIVNGIKEVRKSSK
ncbi:MAG: PepSY domain-containing protein [Clostridium sp.]